MEENEEAEERPQAAENKTQSRKVGDVALRDTKPRRKRGGISPQFPRLLYAMLSRSAEGGYSDIISFLPGGHAFAVFDRQRFVTDVMPFFFKQSSFSSFQRQLNLYGFTRCDAKSTKYTCYAHRMFKQGRADLVESIQRFQTKSPPPDGKATTDVDPPHLLQAYKLAAFSASRARSPASNLLSEKESKPDPSVSGMGIPFERIGSLYSVSHDKSQTSDPKAFPKPQVVGMFHDSTSHGRYLPSNNSSDTTAGGKVDRIDFSSSLLALGQGMMDYNGDTKLLSQLLEPTPIAPGVTRSVSRVPLLRDQPGVTRSVSWGPLSVQPPVTEGTQSPGNQQLLQGSFMHLKPAQASMRKVQRSISEGQIPMPTTNRGALNGLQLDQIDDELHGQQQQQGQLWEPLPVRRHSLDSASEGTLEFLDDIDF